MNAETNIIREETGKAGGGHREMNTKVERRHRTTLDQEVPENCYTVEGIGKPSNPSPSVEKP